MLCLETVLDWRHISILYLLKSIQVLLLTIWEKDLSFKIQRECDAWEYKSRISVLTMTCWWVAFYKSLISHVERFNWYLYSAWLRLGAKYCLDVCLWCCFNRYDFGKLSNCIVQAPQKREQLSSQLASQLLGWVLRTGPLLGNLLEVANQLNSPLVG